MDETHFWAQMAVTFIVAVMASSGFWALVGKYTDNKTNLTKLLLGLAHDRIVWLGMSYLERGWVTSDEYEDFFKYLCEPYSEFGGNGMAEKIMKEVRGLPVRRTPPPGWKPEAILTAGKTAIITSFEEKHDERNSGEQPK